MKIKHSVMIAIATLGVIPLVLTQPSFAEVFGDPQAQPNLSTNERGITDMGSGGFNPINLMHNINRNNRPLDEFNAEKHQNVDEVAAKFRALQLQKLRLQNQTNPNGAIAPTNVPETTPASN
jgi:hypothetical protein